MTILRSVLIRPKPILWTALVSLCAIGCGPSGEIGGDPTDGSKKDTPGAADAGVSSTSPDAIEPNWDAFFIADPPPQYCGPDEVDPPPLPGGTPDCPDDKNREGCPCDVPGEEVACWPGLRVDRNRGTCRDGVAKCEAVGEFINRLGPCEGYVLPPPGTDTCNCFSSGRWELDNLSPCFVRYQSPPNVYAVSTFLDDNGVGQCPTSLNNIPPPQPEPGKSFSSNRLTVDCAGQFRLCYTIKAGDMANPSASDCVLANSCVDFWYDEPGVTQELPPLPGWTSSDFACAKQFQDNGGYGEMSVLGLSSECEDIDDGSGDARVFNRVQYCPSICGSEPNRPECAQCTNGGGGNF